ncbi:PilW family protein [Methylotenera sp. N17]|uniref:PilW family protein n=1 Tax=Methylotenera sp. N17 TaxID=1502761 RepID=UPI0006458185|nr:PilW family protein [Methylotenera sp. N17]
MKNTQRGFSLIELMIGLVIGLIATLVITNVFSKFEQQKRITTGGADAQTNGAIALYIMRREIENAGYGLPFYDSAITPLNCPVNVTFDHDNVGATPEIGLSPLVITDGGTNSDSVVVRSGSTMKSGASVEIISVPDPTPTVQVPTTLGCTKNDTALIMQEISATTLRCAVGRVADITAVSQRIKITNISASGTAVPVSPGFKLACLGGWNETNFTLSGNQLMRTGGFSATANLDETAMPNALSFPVVNDIVNIQAQYGVSAIQSSNTVTEWVNATGIWAPAALSVGNRNRIKAVRVAVVARNPLQERVVVSQNCDGAVSGLARVCVWGDTTNVNLSANANWQNYRYKVYETVVPLRNILWNRQALCGGVPC